MVKNIPSWCTAKECWRFTCLTISRDSCTDCEFSTLCQPTEETTGNGGSTPSQYALPEDAKELQDLIEFRDMNFAQGNIMKAIYRLGIKNDQEYDLNKIIYFAKREINRIKKKEIK